MTIILGIEVKMYYGLKRLGKFILATGTLFPALVSAGALCLFSASLAFTSIDATGAADLQQPASVILITVDTLRADHLGCYGAKQVKTPFIDRLASDGILFKQAIAQVPLTLPSHCSIMTGDYPSYTGVRDNAGFTLSRPTLATIFKAAGYDTGAFVASTILNGRTGLARGFDVYSDLENSEAPERRGNEVMQGALAWMQARAHRRFFLWIHLFDCHEPYAPPEPYRSQYRDDPYDGAVAFVDALIGTMTHTLRINNLYDDTLIVFAADHGEGLGEHGEKTHGLFLYDSTLHIPLIIKAVHSNYRGHTVNEQVRGVDIAPSILQLLGLPANQQMQGRGLLSWIEGIQGQPALDAYSETFYPFYHFQWSPLSSLRQDRYKYIQAPRPELYDLGNDPHERNNLTAKDHSRAAEMEETLNGESRRFSTGPSARAIPAPGKVDTATTERLRSLGYVGFSSGAGQHLVKGNLADPKDKINVYTLLEEAIFDAEAGRIAESKEKLLHLLQEDNTVVDAYINLGVNYGQEGHAAEANEAFKRAVRLDDHNVFAIYNLGLSFADLGKFDESVQAFEEALKIDPNDSPSRVALGRVYLQAEKTDAAVATFKEAISRDPDFAEAHFYLGQAYAAKGQNDSAMDEGRKAARLGYKPQ